MAQHYVQELAGDQDSGINCDRQIRGRHQTPLLLGSKTRHLLLNLPGEYLSVYLYEAGPAGLGQAGKDRLDGDIHRLHGSPGEGFQLQFLWREGGLQNVFSH